MFLTLWEYFRLASYIGGSTVPILPDGVIVSLVTVIVIFAVEQYYLELSSLHIV